MIAHTITDLVQLLDNPNRQVENLSGDPSTEFVCLCCQKVCSTLSKLMTHIKNSHDIIEVLTVLQTQYRAEYGEYIRSYPVEGSGLTSRKNHKLSPWIEADYE